MGKGYTSKLDSQGRFQVLENVQELPPWGENKGEMENILNQKYAMLGIAFHLIDKFSYSWILRQDICTLTVSSSTSTILCVLVSFKESIELWSVMLDITS